MRSFAGNDDSSFLLLLCLLTNGFTGGLLVVVFGALVCLFKQGLASCPPYSTYSLPGFLELTPRVVPSLTIDTLDDIAFGSFETSGLYMVHGTWNTPVCLVTFPWMANTPTTRTHLHFLTNDGGFTKMLFVKSEVILNQLSLTASGGAFIDNTLLPHPTLTCEDALAAYLTPGVGGLNFVSSDDGVGYAMKNIEVLKGVCTVAPTEKPSDAPSVMPSQMPSLAPTLAGKDGKDKKSKKPSHPCQGNGEHCDVMLNEAHVQGALRGQA